MNPVRFWFALFAIFGLAVVAPAWMFWTTEPLAMLPTHVQFLVQLMLPMTVLLLIGSWVQPG